MALALALGAGMAATSMTAQAVYLDNNDGLGDAGIFQYYTVNGGWQTFIRIINTSDDAASVKVRFREAANSREVLDFAVFLSPYDMWSAWTAPNANGGPGVVTNDTSCIYPEPQGNNTGYNDGTEEGFWYQADGSLGANFLTRSFNSPYDDNAIASDEARLGEGHIEVIGIARHEWDSDFGRAVTHTTSNDGKPADCGLAANLFVRDETDDRGLRNVLAMNGYVVNVNNGQGGGFDPDILANFCSDQRCSFVEDALRSATDPDLDSARADGWGPGHQDDFADLHPGIKQKGLPFGPDFTTNTAAVTGGVDAVSYEFMRSSVINEWAADPADVPEAVITDYYTQWVLTFPTKHYYVDLQTDTELRDDVSPTLVDPNESNIINATASNNDAIMPFNEEFDNYGESCEPYRMRMWNREERSRSFTSPEPLIALDLCNETNVLVFDPLYEGEGLNSNFAETIDINAFPTDWDGLPSVRGWASMDFASNDENLRLGNHSSGDLVQDRRYLCNGTDAVTGEACLIGLPVTGWMLTIYETGEQTTNHTTINSHKYARTLQVQD
jgi:hypothetical protein